MAAMAQKKKQEIEDSEEVLEERDESPEEEEDDELLEAVGELSREETSRALYALLFASDRPLSAGRLAEALGGIDPMIVAALLEELQEQVAGQDLPYTLREIAGGYQFTTKPEHAPFIRRLFQLKRKNKLSKVVLETLAIIAYRQPVTRTDVESIRGVSVSHAFGQLQDRRLIKAVGVAPVPGRPRLYRTTDEFLLHFGLNSLDEMPSMEDIREMA